MSASCRGSRRLRWLEMARPGHREVLRYTAYVLAMRHEQVTGQLRARRLRDPEHRAPEIRVSVRLELDDFVRLGLGRSGQLFLDLAELSLQFPQRGRRGLLGPFGGDRRLMAFSSRLMLGLASRLV